MGSVAKEYAKALYGSVEKSDQKIEILNFLRGFSEVLKKDSNLLEQVQSKAIKSDQVKDILNSLVAKMNTKEILNNFFNLLVDKNRLVYIPEISEEFQMLMDEENGVIRGVVKSASAISPEKKDELEEKFSKKLDKKVILTYQKDAKVVAGLRVNVGAYTFDDTVERHLKNIKENINRS